jgi:hypothetical protein
MTIIAALPFTLQNGTTADATQVMADFDEIVNDVNANAAHNGVNTDITALTGLTTPLTPAQGGSRVYTGSVSTGTANVQVVATTSPIGFALTTGNRVTFIAQFTNTGSLTVNVAATGALIVYRKTPIGLIPLSGGEVIGGTYIEIVYDGAQWELTTSAAQVGGFGPSTVLASATTTDLGTIPSHLVAITGNVTITGFGSSAVTTFPVYRIVFTGVLVLTYNASTMLLPGAANITTASSDTCVARYLGGGAWQVTDYTRFTGTAVVSPIALAGAQGLVIANNSGTPNTNVDVVADQVVMTNSAGTVSFYASAVNRTINTTVNGADGLDTGSRAANTWYNIFLIANGSSTVGLASLSATAPTMPGGYIYLVRVGAMRTDGSGNFYRTRQQGSHAVDTSGAPRSMATGSNAAWTAIATGAYVPPTATQIKGIMANQAMGNNTTCSVAPNNSYATTSVGNVATTPWTITNSTGAASGLSANMVFEFNLESTNIYYGSNSGSSTAISCLGWTDKVNAN